MRSVVETCRQTVELCEKTELLPNIWLFFNKEISYLEKHDKSKKNNSEPVVAAYQNGGHCQLAKNSQQK